MQEIKILHLYSDLMNLYGDYANADILARALTACGVAVHIDKQSIGDDFKFAEYDFIYIGSGTERGQRACASDLLRYKDEICGMIESGLKVLATGNSHEIFGRAVTTGDGERYETLGLLDFETVQESRRVTGDSIYAAAFLPGKLIGFINRAGGRQIEAGMAERPFSVLFGPERDIGTGNIADSSTAGDAGNAATDIKTGICYKNLLGTYLTGPVLVRNPPLLKYYINLLIGDDSGEMLSEIYKTDRDNPKDLFHLQEKTYTAALAELEERSGSFK